MSVILAAVICSGLLASNLDGKKNEIFRVVIQREPSLGFSVLSWLVDLRSLKEFGCSLYFTMKRNTLATGLFFPVLRAAGSPVVLPCAGKHAHDWDYKLE